MTTFAWTLDDNWTPVPASDYIAWAHWMNRHARRLRTLTRVDARTTVSTVFLGTPLGFPLRGPSLFWETAVCSPDRVDVRRRYATHHEAMEGHHAIVTEQRSHMTGSIKALAMRAFSGMIYEARRDRVKGHQLRPLWQRRNSADKMRRFERRTYRTAGRKQAHP